MPAQFNIYL